MNIRLFTDLAISHDLEEMFQRADRVEIVDKRSLDRIELNVPAEIVTANGDKINAMTRDINRYGVGFRHRDPILIGEATARLFGGSSEHCYRMAIQWCVPCGYDEFESGGIFLTKAATDNSAE